MSRPRPPKTLDKTAQAKWKEIVGTLPDSEPATLDAAACYCVAFSRWTAAEAKVQELGPVIRASGGTAAVNPYVTVASSAARQMRQLAAELKLTPKARGTRKQAEAPPQDPILKLLSRAE